MSTNANLPLATSTWDDAEYRAIQDVVDSGRFTLGDKVTAFEAAFAAHVGSEYAVMVNSGSSANLLAVAAAVLDGDVDLQAGDEVLVTAVSWATTYYPLMQYGLRPVLVDVDPNTLNMDLAKARAAISPRTRAVMAVNLLGNPNDFDALSTLCSEHSLTLLIDNCEALGASFGGREAGTHGLMGTYSTYFSHHISTMEGGLIVTDSERHRDMLLSLRSHGWTRGLPTDSHLRSEPVDDFQGLFHFVLPGYNVRPLEMSGAIGLHQLEKLPSIVANRRDNAVAYQELLGDVPGVRLQREVGESSWFGFSIILTDRLAGRRAEVVAALRGAGVDVRPIVAGNFARNPVMRHSDVRVAGRLHRADEVHTDGLFIGNHHYSVREALSGVREVLLAAGASRGFAAPRPRAALKRLFAVT